MRATITLLAVLASLSLSTTSPALAGSSGAAASVPIYPGAVAAPLPSGVALKAPPAKVKSYSTSDAFATVKAWYHAHLKGAPEMQQPGMEKTEDTFLVGQGASATAVMIRSVKGKTWILIGPPM
jgi:hypothetical protein